MKPEDGGEWLAIKRFTQAFKAADKVVKHLIVEEFEDLRKEFMATTIKSIMNDEIEIDGCKCGSSVMLYNVPKTNNVYDPVIPSTQKMIQVGKIK